MTKAEKYAQALMATTCLGIASTGSASAGMILFVEGTFPSTDFPNASPGFGLPVGTNVVQGQLHVSGDHDDYFEFQGLFAGHNYSLLGTYNPLGQERGVSFFVFNSSATQIGAATLEGEGGLVSGTIPNDGKLRVDVKFAQNTGPNPAWQMALTAESATVPEPGTAFGTALGLAGAWAWRRKRSARP